MIKNEIRPLTGIRGIAALWVVCYHFEPDMTRLIPASSVFHPFFNQGALGVDVFFVLSGFIISNVYKIEKLRFTKTNYRHFLVNRLARIYPNYLFCLLILMSMVATDHLLAKHMATIGKHLTDPSEYPVSSVGWHVFMMQAWPLIPAHWSNWNAPAWSVSAEWFAYLFFFPLSVWLTSISIVRKFSPVFAFALLASFLVCRQLAVLHGFYFVIQIAAEFMSGCLVYIFYVGNPQIIKTLACRFDIVILAFVAAVCVSTLSPICFWLIIFTIPVIIIGLTHESSLFAKLLASSGFCYLGRISYALYLVHSIAHRMLHIALPIDRYAVSLIYSRMMVLLLYFLFPILLAMGIYHLIEEPSRLAIRRWCYPTSR